MIYIYLANYLPRKNREGEVEFIAQKNWAIEINGQVYYGAHTKDDIEKALIVLPYHPLYEKS